MGATKAEAGHLGGTARARNLTPEQLSAIGHRATLVGSVKRIVKAWPSLTEEQRDVVRRLVAPVEDQ